MLINEDGKEEEFCIQPLSLLDEALRRNSWGFFILFLRFLLDCYTISPSKQTKKEKQMDQQYIEWIYPGSFFAETSEEKVSNRNRPNEIPKNAMGYRFFSRKEVLDEGDVLYGAKKDYSQYVYFGEEYNLEQVRQTHGENSTLFRNMKNNYYKRVCCTRFGNYVPLNDNDKVELV